MSSTTQNQKPAGKTTKTQKTASAPKEDTNWVLLTINKERVKKTLDKCIIFRVSSCTDVIIPLCFKRAKETDEVMFFSVPNDFKLSCSTATFDEENDEWNYKDFEYRVLSSKGKLTTMAYHLRNPMETEENPF